MSKTTPKSTKKPTQLDRIEALAKSAHAESGLAHAATLALQQRIDAMRHEQAALSQESRSAPVEDKAKEEQRAKEAEWAKYDVLQEGDACRCSYDKACRLAQKAMDGGVPTCWPGKDASGVYFTSSGYVHQANSGFVEAQTYPEDEWERRLQGTIAKRAEEERTKELAKPLEMGTPVRYGQREGVYLWNDAMSAHRLALKPTDQDSAQLVIVKRDQFQIID